MMPPAEDVPRQDFLEWFDSLPTEVQREVLHRVFAEHELFFDVIDVTELFANSTLHLPACNGPMILLN